MKGIIFDLDGTMIDNMMVHHRAWQQKLKELGMDLELEEVRQRVHGINEEILERLFGDRFTPDDRRRISMEKEAEYRKIFLPELRLIDGLPDFLDQIQTAAIPMGIGTAAPPENVDFVLDNLQIRSMFQTVLHARDVEKGKPDPEIYLKVAAKLEIDPLECLVFEDTPAGAEAAQRAGCALVVITTTHPPKEFQHLNPPVAFLPNYKEAKLTDLFQS